MKRIISLATAVIMLFSIAPFALAMPTKDSQLNSVLNGQGTDLNYTNDANYPWEIATVDGLSYAKSTINGIPNGIASISAMTIVQAGTVISFDYIVSSENRHDEFIFRYITDQNPEGEVLQTLSGEQQGTYSFLVTETNRYTFLWTYAKDSSVNNGQDSVYIRNVVLSQAAAPTSFEIDEDEISVLPGLTSKIAVTFAPENSYATLSWSSSNQSVATVNANGVVTGVSTGTATITATYGSMSDTITVNVLDTETVPTVEGFRISSENEYSLGRIRNYTLPDGSNTTIDLPFSLPIENVKSGSYHDGNIYAVSEDNLYKVDYNTGNATMIGSCGPIRGMSYDYSQDRMLGIVSDKENTNIQYIVEVDLETGATAMVCTSERKLLTIAVNLVGDVYAVDYATGNLFLIDLETGTTTLEMTTGVQAQYLQSMAFNYNTGILYWASCSATEENLYAIDLNANTKTLVYEGFGEIVGLFVPGEVGEPVPVTGITLNHSSLEIGLCQSVTLSANVEPSNAANQRVTWESSNPEVATVNDGTVRGNAPGTAIITVTSVEGGFTASCEITVIGEFILYEDFEDELFGWTILDEDGDGYSWMSMKDFSNGQVLGYEGNDMFTSQSYINADQNQGQHQALDPDNWLISPEFTIPTDGGSVRLNWLAGSEDGLYPDHYSVYVGVGSASPDTFTTPIYSGMAPGNFGQYSADLSAYAGQTVRVAFRHYDSSDCYMLNIDMITVSVSEAGAYVPVNGLTLDTESAVLTIGSQLTLTATVSPENATDRNVTWTSSDETVATVENGVVTALAYGEVTITAKTADGAFSAVCVIKVFEKGDVTGDGKLNTGDAVAMLRKIAGLDNPSYVTEIEDYNADGNFNAGDAVAVLRKIAGLE